MPTNNPPVTNCVEFIYGVMGDLYPQFKAQHGESTDQLVAQAISQFMECFKQLNQGACPQYDTLLWQFAYLYFYATVRACATYSIMRQFSDLERLFDRKHLDVCCIGGGPGTELIGIAKYFGTTGKCNSVSATICDKHGSWNTVWRAIHNRLPSTLRINASYVEQDFLNPHGCRASLNHIRADLYTISYCLAEFRSRQAQAEPYFDQLFSAIPSHSYLLFMEVRYSNDFTWFDRLAHAHGLESLPDQFSNYQGECNPYQMNPHEKRAAEKGYQDKGYQWWWPKTDPKIAYRLCKKV